MGKIVLCPDAWKIPPPTLPNFVCRTCLASTNDDDLDEGSGVTGGDVNFSGGAKEVNGRSVDEAAGVAEARKPLEDDFSLESGRKAPKYVRTLLGCLQMLIVVASFSTTQLY